MFCTECGAQLNDKAVMCPKCGVVIRGNPIRVATTSEDAALRLLLPVGKSFLAILSKWIGVVALIVFAGAVAYGDYDIWSFCMLLMGVSALGLGILALFDIKLHPKKIGRGQAWFGVVMGGGSLIAWCIIQGQLQLMGRLSFRLGMPIAFAIAACLTLLYIWNPSEMPYFPRCPFLSLTGFKCPGCGTLRGIHALLHLRVTDAMRFNLFMVVSIPLVLMLVAYPKFRFNPMTTKMILCMTFLWWLVRNLI